ncbi:MAG: TIM barrel protein [Saprospiraceae bacterium]|nr:TIM barrel protein [Saprospiraceae bacterium]MBP6567053.1 TIM barrel protein [Saprospiraceae bacterium]
MNRRNVLKQSALSVAALAAGGNIFNSLPSNEESKSLKNNINHSVCQWTYNHISLEALCLLVKNIGFSAIDLIGPKDWPVLKKYGIDSSMCNGAEIGLTKGWNDTQYHGLLIKNYTDHIDLVAAAGYKNLICFSGNREGKDDETGMNTCVTGLKKIMGHAEKKGVIIQMELFNSKVDHKDYMCDKSAWGVELCKKLDSPNFKLLYDIYHMQINEGDIIRTIQRDHVYFGHYHTAGVPGRHEIDESQELYYPAIMKAIVATGYKGYVAQEFITTAKGDKQKEKALQKAIKICDV